MPRKDVTVIHSKAPDTKKIQELMHLLKTLTNKHWFPPCYASASSMQMGLQLKKQIYNYVAGERPREK